MPNPITVACDPSHFTDVLGKSLDGEFVFKNARFNIESDDLIERTGVVELWYYGPLSTILYPAYKGSLSYLQLSKDFLEKVMRRSNPST